MPIEVDPPELARLLDFAERPRTDDWSLRAALVRYAQPEPERVARLVELIRRTEWAIQQEAKQLEREGPALWGALEGGAPPEGDGQARIVALLRNAAVLDQFGDRLAAWAVDRAGRRPDVEADDAIGVVTAGLDELQVPREDPDARPPGRRG